MQSIQISQATSKCCTDMSFSATLQPEKPFEEKTLAPQPCFTDLLRHGAIMETFLKYVPPKDLQTVAHCRNFRAVTARSFPVKYLNDKAKNILSVPYFSLTTAPIVCCECEKVAYMAMLRNGLEFKILSEELRSNITVIKFAIISILKSNESWTKKSKNIKDILDKIPENVRGKIKARMEPFIVTATQLLNKSTLPNLMKHSLEKLETITYLFYEDADICLAAVGIDGSLLSIIDSPFQANRKFVLKAVQNKGSALEFASPELQDDEEIVALAVRTYGWALRFASPRSQNNERIVSLAVQHTGWALQFASPRLQNNEEIVSLAVQQDGDVLVYTNPEIRRNVRITSLAIQQRAWAIANIDAELQNNAKIVSLAVQQIGLTLRFAEI